MRYTICGNKPLENHAIRYMKCGNKLLENHAIRQKLTFRDHEVYLVDHWHTQQAPVHKQCGVFVFVTGFWNGGKSKIKGGSQTLGLCQFFLPFADIWVPSNLFQNLFISETWASIVGKCWKVSGRVFEEADHQIKYSAYSEIGVSEKWLSSAECLICNIFKSN